MTRQLQDSLRTLRARIVWRHPHGQEVFTENARECDAVSEGRLTKQKPSCRTGEADRRELQSGTNRADISFNVQPGPVVDARIEGAHVWSWTKRKLLPIYQQNGLNPELIQEGRQNLLKHFRQKGFFDVMVDTQVEAQDGKQTILYKVTKGPHKKIEDGLSPATRIRRR